eukprot:scaffold2098_cov120-Isochrysis_galbana.AAC.2
MFCAGDHSHHAEALQGLGAPGQNVDVGHSFQLRAPSGNGGGAPRFPAPRIDMPAVGDCKGRPHRDCERAHPQPRQSLDSPGDIGRT